MRLDGGVSLKQAQVIDRYGEGFTDKEFDALQTTLSALYPKKDAWQYHMERYSLLNHVQKQAIATFLQSIPHLLPLDHEDTQIIPRALRNYWEQYAGGAKQPGR